MKKKYLGIELGSTRIKAVLIDDTYKPVASGSYEWENSLENGFWTYSREKIFEGIKKCYSNLKADFKEKSGETIHAVDGIGISAMMHGYIALDSDDNFLVPFRTWRNTTTKQAAEELTEKFDFNIPQRWSISHLYQAILNGEEHINKIKKLTTLSGYIHYLLTGRFEIGIGDASGMFPINNGDYDEKMLNIFQNLAESKGISWNIKDILPQVKNAGEQGARLTEEGAKFLDESGDLQSGIMVCPPEGDAGTGMVATNAVRPKSGNISAGTSIFSMLVLEENLKKHYPQIDIVTTPDGSPVAMVHGNNCCNELDTWVNMFNEFSHMLGVEIDKSNIYEMLYNNAVDGNCKGITAYNFLSGEPIVDVEAGKPMYFRNPDSSINLAGFFKAQIFSSFAALVMGMKILFENEKVTAQKFMAHGGLFKTPKVAQQMLSNALNTPVSVMETAGEGGAWGMALLAAYMMNKGNETLPCWLDNNVFNKCNVLSVSPNEKGTKEFEEYMSSYEDGLMLQRLF